MNQKPDIRKLFVHPNYLDDIKYVNELNIPWNKLEHKSLLISGATGLIGSFLVDVLMRKNREGLCCNIHIITRNISNAQQRFSLWDGSDCLRYIEGDLSSPVVLNDLGKIDMVLHLASNTHPYQYARDPINTILTNIFGLKTLLDFAVKQRAERFLFASSNEIYGENRGDTELFQEDYCGYLDSNTLRAAYPESKRCGEALCQAYRVQRELDVVIPRLTRSYGPTMLPTDTKAISQFILNAVYGKQIVLKSDGMQYYSYTYMADAVSGLLTVLLSGQNGEAYNIADEASDIRLKDLAALIANEVDQKVVFELPDSLEASGYSKATKARLDGRKLKQMGWKSRFTIYEGIHRTVSVMRQIYE